MSGFLEAHARTDLAISWSKEILSLADCSLCGQSISIVGQGGWFISWTLPPMCELILFDCRLNCSSSTIELQVFQQITLIGCQPIFRCVRIQSSVLDLSESTPASPVIATARQSRCEPEQGHATAEKGHVLCTNLRVRSGIFVSQINEDANTMSTFRDIQLPSRRYVAP